MAPSLPFVVVWDLDRTLGVFDCLEQIRDDSERVTVHLRPGIAGALAELSAAGFLHVALTMASRSYAELALVGSGLRPFFCEVAGAGERAKGDAHGIAQMLGIPIERCADQMLFVGDHLLFDPPQDPRVVFHLEPHCLARPAEQVVRLVLGLRAEGQGSLRAGFDAWVAQAADDRGLRRLDRTDLGRLWFALRGDEAAPVVAFDDLGLDPPDDTAVSFVPAHLPFWDGSPTEPARALISARFSSPAG